MNAYYFILTFCIFIVIVIQYSNLSSLPTQLLMHFISAVFLYIWLFQKPKKEVNNENLTTKNITLHTLSQEERSNCLRKTCQHAATKKECDSYARCTWNDETSECAVKAKQCEDILKPADCTNDCIWSNDQKKCEWDASKLQSGEIQDHKIINENSRLNRYCFKNEEARDKPGDKYVEDHDHVNCLETNPEEVCIKKSKLKLDCNSIKGNVFNFKKGTCTSINLGEQEKCLKPHVHYIDEMPYKPIKGSRPSYSFQLREDTMLQAIMNSFVIFFVFVANVGLIGFFNHKT